MKIKAIITGATGMVGEGVLMEWLWKTCARGEGYCWIGKNVKS